MTQKERDDWYSINYKYIVDPIWTYFHNLGLEYGQISNIFDRWSEPHRYYHNLNYLSEILDLMRDEDWTPENGYDKILLYSALFHDAVYDPTRSDNEEKSVKKFDEYVNWYVNLYPDEDTGCKELSDEDIETIKGVIIDTKSGIPNSEYSAKFIRYDRYNLLHGDFKTVLSKTLLLFKEQQFMDFIEWREKQIKFLTKFITGNKSIKDVISYLEVWKPNIGVYAGSFNPFHLGHLNILHKAENIFDKVIIALGVNPEKSKNGDWSDSLNNLKYHQIEHYEGFLTHFMDKLGYDTTLIRGLRNSTDLQYEMTQFQYLQDMKPDIKIVNIFCDKEFEHISSSAIRSLSKLDPKFGDKYLDIDEYI